MILPSWHEVCYMLGKCHRLQIPPRAEFRPRRKEETRSAYKEVTPIVE